MKSIDSAKAEERLRLFGALEPITCEACGGKGEVFEYQDGQPGREWCGDCGGLGNYVPDVTPEVARAVTEELRALRDEVEKYREWYESGEAKNKQALNVALADNESLRDEVEPLRAAPRLVADVYRKLLADRREQAERLKAENRALREALHVFVPDPRGFECRHEIPLDEPCPGGGPGPCEYDPVRAALGESG